MSATILAYNLLLTDVLVDGRMRFNDGAGMSTYDRRDVVRLMAVFKENGVLVDPATVTLVVQAPDDVDYLPPGFMGSTGQRYFDLDLSTNGVGGIPGVWRYAWSCTGPDGAQQGKFRVRRSYFNDEVAAAGSLAGAGSLVAAGT